MPLNTEKLEFRITGDSRGFKNAVKQSEKSVNGFQSRLKGLSSSMKLAFAAAGVAMAGAAVKSALTFDRSMTKIKSLVGIASDEVDAMGKTAMKMSEDTGRSASEAADALFFITSAGLRGAEAMDVLEASLKASAVGLGETKSIADLTTSAINAYGSSNLSAMEATNVLVASVREGKLEASELASSMGQVLPVASNMGVSFDEVGAALAAMSRTGTNASVGATQLTAVLAGLLKPTMDAEKALDEMGLSSTGLKQQIKEQGLLAVLKTLKIEFDKNADAASRVFPNIRALKAVLDLTGASADVNNKIFRKLENTLGALDTAYQTTSESASQRFDKSLNKISVSATRLANPIISGLAVALESLDAFFISDNVVEFGGSLGITSTNMKNLSKSSKSYLEIMVEGLKKINLEYAKAKALVGPVLPPTPNFDLSDLLGDDKPKKVKELGIGFTQLSKIFKKNEGFKVGEIIPQTSIEKSNELIANIGKLFTGFTDLNTFVMTGVNLSDVFSIAKKSADDLKTATEVLTEGFQNIAFAVAASFVNMALAGDKSILQIINSLAKMILQMTVALVIMTALRTLMGDVQATAQLATTLAVAGGIIAGAGLIALATNEKPKEFASGGIVTSPTIGMVGEAGSEAIIPLSKLPQMMGAMGGGNSNGQFTLRGQDLILALERAGNFKARITG
tara:strand:+ start:1351 stop:3393 length:2043 start_codon:yes stop_codon:yes gene_type:complete